MAPLRRPLQGLWNVVRFNWHFYAIALALALGLTAVALFAPGPITTFALWLPVILLAPMLMSLLVTAYVYDFSPLYKLNWLPAKLPAGATVLTLNAGFDEISASLAAHYPEARLLALDFYHPDRHTEVSIRRARQAYPPYPGTQVVDTRQPLPLASASVDVAVAFLAAHEIRDDHERAAFFREIRRILKPGGHFFVTEHLRDQANFLAYTVGFLHFHSRSTWQQTFRAAGLRLEQLIACTPFVSTFVLRSDENAV